VGDLCVPSRSYSAATLACPPDWMLFNFFIRRSISPSNSDTVMQVWLMYPFPVESLTCTCGLEGCGSLLFRSSTKSSSRLGLLMVFLVGNVQHRKAGDSLPDFRDRHISRSRASRYMRIGPNVRDFSRMGSSLEGRFDLMEGTSGQGGCYADQVAGAGSWIHSTEVCA